MEPFTAHTGRMVPLRRGNVDTDQIIPASYLKRVTRTGFADGLFKAWRADPGFVLDRPEYAGATILVTGPDFGTGSSREHAVWALLDHGFRVVVSSRFADIFRGNALKNGLLTVEVDPEVAGRLLDLAETDSAAEMTVDLHACRLRTPHEVIDFTLDDYSRSRLLAGLDDIAVTLTYLDAIEAYERTRPGRLPATQELPS